MKDHPECQQRFQNIEESITELRKETRTIHRIDKSLAQISETLKYTEEERKFARKEREETREYMTKINEVVASMLETLNEHGRRIGDSEEFKKSANLSIITLVKGAVLFMVGYQAKVIFEIFVNR